METTMNYDHEIKRILWEAGREGLSIKKIAHHVFNLHNSFFETTSYDDVYRAVVYCVAKNKKAKEPFMEHAEKRGLYRLTQKSNRESQLMFQFEEHEDEIVEKPVIPDQSLSLFD